MFSPFFQPAHKCGCEVDNPDHHALTWPECCISTVYHAWDTPCILVRNPWAPRTTPDQNGVSLQYIMFEIHHSGRKPLSSQDYTWPEWCISTVYHAWDTPFWSETLELPGLHLTRMVYLYSISCLRYTILVGNPWAPRTTPDQNGVSLLYIMLEIHHSGRKPLSSQNYCLSAP